MACSLSPEHRGELRYDTMKENRESGKATSRRPARKPLIVAAAVLAVVQACLTIEGRGIEGFVLWVLILFGFYLLLFNVLLWLWGRYRERP
jgi:hypothetical protein